MTDRIELIKQKIKGLSNSDNAYTLDEVYKEIESGDFCAGEWFGHGDDCFNRGMELGYQEAIEEALAIIDGSKENK